MARNQFIDPNGVRTTYSWAINHTDEDEAGKTRNIENSANTANTGFVRQQSDSGPLIFRFTGTILSKAQIEEMIAWWELCSTQSIHFLDFAGDRYEVIITSFTPKRRRTIRNPRDFANAPYWYWNYTIEMNVISVLDGIWEGVTG